MEGDEDVIRYLTRDDVQQAVAAIDVPSVVRRALELHAAGRTTLPPEAYLPWTTEDGSFARSLALPGALWGDDAAIGLKVINSSHANLALGRPRAGGLTLLFDRESARPVAVMDAGLVSILRTAAYTAVSVRLLAAAEVERIAIIGCGPIGVAHIDALGPVVPGAAFVLFDADPARARAAAAGVHGVASSCEAACRGAGIVVTATTTTEGYIPYRWLSPGTLVAHVSLDDVLPEVVTRADVVVVDDWSLVRADDRRLLGRMFRAGELLGPGGDAWPDATTHPDAATVDAAMADVLSGRHPGRTSPEQVVLSNPFGMGILDVALAAEVHRSATAAGLGTLLPT